MASMSRSILRSEISPLGAVYTKLRGLLHGRVIIDWIVSQQEKSVITLLEALVNLWEYQSGSGALDY